jgi:hypothetical protein
MLDTGQLHIEFAGARAVAGAPVVLQGDLSSIRFQLEGLNSAENGVEIQMSSSAVGRYRVKVNGVEGGEIELDGRRAATIRATMPAKARLATLTIYKLDAREGPGAIGAHR